MTQSVKLASISQPNWHYVENELGVDDPVLNPPTPEDILVHIARVSSSRSNTLEDPEPLVRYLIKNQHWSPFEHTFCTFEINTSLPIATQYLRHRSFTFQQFSQRYGKAPGVMQVELRRQAETNRQSSTDIIGTVSLTCDKYGEWKYSYDTPVDLPSSFRKQTLDTLGRSLVDSIVAYESLLDDGVARECARFVLPQATATKLYMSGPLRSWIHLIGLREDKHAQKEAQEIAVLIKEILVETFPLTSSALGWKENG